MTHVGAYALDKTLSEGKCNSTDILIVRIFFFVRKSIIQLKLQYFHLLYSCHDVSYKECSSSLLQSAAAQLVMCFFVSYQVPGIVYQVPGYRFVVPFPSSAVQLGEGFTVRGVLDKPLHLRQTDHLQIDHDLDHLVSHLPLSKAVQGLRSTDPTRDMFLQIIRVQPGNMSDE